MNQDILYGQVLDGLNIPDLKVDTSSVATGFSRFSKAPEFTNECLDSIIGTVDHKNKKILGILGSGDYAISALANDCKQFTGVDISIFSCLYTELKIAALRNLNYDEFKKFFCFPSNIKERFDDVFSQKAYDCFKHDLSQTARTFFDKIIGIHLKNAENYYEKFLISNYIETIKTISEIDHVPYLKNEMDYRLAQEKIQNQTMPLLLTKDIGEFINSSKEKFDIIYLSNVPDHVEGDHFERGGGAGKGVDLIQKSHSLLNQGGVTVVCNIVLDLLDLSKQGSLSLIEIKPANLDKDLLVGRYHPQAYIFPN